jgi:hypothetical protein
MTEFESSASNFHIDHYHPQDHGGPDDYDNLLYSCALCNTRKSNYWPPVIDGVSSAAAADMMLVRPDKDDPRDHFRLAAERDLLEHKTKRGRATIIRLDLNSRARLDLRRRRRRLFQSERIIENGLRRLRDLRWDELKGPERRGVARLVAESTDDFETLKGDMAALLKTICSSPLLDPDPEAPERRKEWRLFLKEQKALTGTDSFEASIVPPSLPSATDDR